MEATAPRPRRRVLETRASTRQIGGSSQGNQTTWADFGKAVVITARKSASFLVSVTPSGRAPKPDSPDRL